MSWNLLVKGERQLQKCVREYFNQLYWTYRIPSVDEIKIVENAIRGVGEEAITYCGHKLKYVDDNERERKN